MCLLRKRAAVERGLRHTACACYEGRAGEHDVNFTQSGSQRSRRSALRASEGAGAGAEGLVVAGQPVELTISPVGDHIVRISLVPLDAGKPRAIPATGALVEGKSEAPVLRVTQLAEPREVACGESRVKCFRGRS